MIERFPSFRGKIVELYFTNEDFKALCIDYWQCRNNLARLSQQTAYDNRTDNSYKMLSLDLEEEVLTHLKRPEKA